MTDATQEVVLERRVIQGRNAVVFSKRTVRIYGTPYDNADGSSRQETIKKLVFGDIIRFEREPSNAFDTNAIAAMSDCGQIGYISKELAAVLAKEMDAGWIPFGLVQEIRSSALGIRHVEVYLFEYDV